MSSAEEHLVENALEAAKKAIQFDGQKQIEASAYYYEAAERYLTQAISLIEDPERSETLQTKAEEYKNRAKELREITNNEQGILEENPESKIVKQCYFLLQQGLAEDEQGDKEYAIESYAQAVEYMTQFPEFMKGELKTLILNALERAEELKSSLRKQVQEASSKPIPNLVQQSTSTQQAQNKKLHRGSSGHLQVSGSGTYSEEEKKVLLVTSRINGRDYVPFMSVDLAEKFQYSIPFTDKDGALALAPKQRRDFYKFVRPDEITSDPCVVHGLSPNYLNIKQTVISDCSFVASLAVSASYEMKFGRKLVTSIIYPQSKDKRPLYNPFGKYMIKLHINGVSRKVIIDDYLPIDRFGRLLCSYSANKTEFWISLLEKAYMKVMGGYDFPGSNSSIDLHALTGWIPERSPIRRNDPDFNKDGLFATLESRMAKGDVLVTVATGELSDQEAERSGLVATHAYAVLDVRTVNNLRLLKLKNPWSHLRWKGRFSEMDSRSWTQELQNLLNYDPNSAAQFDNGVFWIDFDSVCAFFDVFYMNWNPELFKYTYCIHQTWNAGTGPVKDLYSVAANPQFCLELSPEVSGAVWILLSRHITDIEDFRENKEYITVYVYKNGKKVYYPYDPPPYIDGVKINSPHYLCKIILGPGSSRKYTIIVSQYEKSATIFYTLRAYATCPFTLTKIQDPYIQEKQLTGEWKGISAGGCPNHPNTYQNNPKFKITIDNEQSNNHLLIELKGPKQYQIGVEAIITQVNDTSITASFKTKSSGPYRSGYVVLELDNVPGGTLKLIPSTFLPSQEGPFIISVKSSAPFQFS